MSENALRPDSSRLMAGSDRSPGLASGSEIQILLVENEQRWREFIGNYLKGKGYSVELAGSLEEAQSKLVMKRFSLIFTNLHLVSPPHSISLFSQSDYQGVDVIAAVHQYAPGTPCFIISGNPNLVASPEDPSPYPEYVNLIYKGHKGQGFQLQTLVEIIRNIPQHRAKVQERYRMLAAKWLSSGAVRFSNAFALVIGVGQYERIRPLAKPPQDAQAISELLTDPQCAGYEPGNVKCLKNAAAGKAAILDGLSWLAAQARRDSTVLVFFSGHGGQDPNTPSTGNYLLPYDCDPFDQNGLNPVKLADSAISSEEFTQAINAINCQKLVIIFDCCHAGGVGDVSRDLYPLGQQMRAGLSEAYYESLGHGSGRIILASCLPEEVSWEREVMPNGIFTTHLLAALRGRAAIRGDGLIHILDVFHDLNTHVPPDAAQCTDPATGRPAEQHPFLKAAMRDNFPVALHQASSPVV